MKKKDDLREQFAAYVHEAWSGWMQYMFSKTRPRADGNRYVHRDIVLPEVFVTRWQHQCATPYSKLTGEEKESDRAEADKILARFATQLQALVEWIEEPCLSRDSKVYCRAMDDVLSKLRALGLVE